MLTEITLNPEQKQSLADRIEELYLMDSIVATGLEIHDIVRNSRGTYKVMFSYERENNTVGHGTVFCTFGFDGDTNRVVDFEEAV